MKVCGGLMLAETERDIEFLKGKIALEKQPRYRGRAHRCQRAARAWSRASSDVAIAAEWCPGEGKINPLKATYAVVAKRQGAGRASGAAATFCAIERDGRALEGRHQPRRDPRRRVVNTAGAVGAAGRGAWLGVDNSRERRAAADGRHRAHGADAVAKLVAYAHRHLTLKQMASGAFLIGGGWTAGLDEQNRLSRALRPSVEGNLWIASRAVPALADLHAIRIWAGMNVNIDRAPILGEVPGLPGFYNCVGSNGYTLAPVLSRLTAEMLAGRVDQPAGGGVLDQAVWLTVSAPVIRGARRGQATR